MLTTAEHSNIIKEEWVADFYKELLPALGIASLISNDYEGEIKQWGDTVNVPSVASPGRAQVLTADNQAYTPKQFVPAQTQLVVNKSATFAFDVTNWAHYQSSPAYQAKYRSLAAHEVARAIDDQIISTISEGSSESSVTAMTKAKFAQAKRVLDKLNVPMEGRVALIDPQYEEDLLGVGEVLSTDYNGGASPLLDGKLVNTIYGFQVYISNLLSADNAYFFHPSFMHIAVQKEASYKEIDLEAKNNVESYRGRVSNLFGLKQFDSNRVYRIYNT